MKVSEYRDLLNAVREQWASCRGCTLNERSNEVRLLRKLLGELAGAECLRANLQDKTRVFNTLEETAKWLKENNL